MKEAIFNFKNTGTEKKYLIFFILIYLIRLLISTNMGIMPQDAYYYFYSQHIDLSYFDHPPMVAYGIKLFTSIFGNSVLVLKLSNFIISLGTIISFYYLGRKFLSKTRNSNSVLLFGSTLLLTVLSMNTTPDVPLMLFWTLSLICLYEAVFNNKFWYWPLSGFVMALCFDSKYTGFFLIACLLLFMLLSSKYRKYIFSLRFALLLLCFIVTVLPVYLWNEQHDWISFKFQTSNRASSIFEFELKPIKFLGHAGLQSVLLIPVLFATMFSIFFKQIKQLFKKKKLPNEKILFLVCFSLPIIIFFYAISLIYWVKLNWLMPSYITAIILCAIFIKNKHLKPQLIISIVLHSLLLIQILFYVIQIKSDDTWYGWEESAAKVETIANNNPDCFIFSNDNYKTTAILNYYLEEKVYANNIIGKNALQFLIIDNDLSKLVGKDAIYIDSDKKLKNEEKSNKKLSFAKKYFNNYDELDPILIKDSNGKLQRKFYVYKLYNYKGSQKSIDQNKQLIK